MTSRSWIPLVLPLLYLGPHDRATPGPVGPEGYEQVFAALRGMTPRADRVAAVRDVVVRRDAGEFRLAEGTLVLLSEVSGRTVAAAFVGTGSLSFAPPLSVERAQLRRVLGDTVLETPISAAVFIFADSTLAELERRVSFGPGTVGGGVRDRVGDALDFITDGRERWADPTLMTALLNGDANGFFAAYVKRHRGDDLMVQVDPHAGEEILLLRRGKQVGQRVEVVCQFPRAEDLRDSAAVAARARDPLAVEAYRIEATIGKNLDFSAVATLRVTARRDAVHWAPFVLFEELDVDSVRVGGGGGGPPATFYRRKRGSSLWVRFKPPLRRGQADSMRIAYHGDLITHGSVADQFLPPWWDPARRRLLLSRDTWFFIKATSTWFPRHGYWQAADMNLTFRTPGKYRFASVGRLVESRVEGDVRTTRWVTELPTAHASFNIGEFEEFEISDPRIPPVTVHVNGDAHRSLAALIPGVRRPEEHVGGDVANSLAFFGNVFGRPLFERYYATETPYWHGQAFPGLIHLSWWTFQDVDESGEHETFRAHEMAHQWWGIGVEPAGYRDAWLSEGFAEFSGLWYMQVILRDNEKYFRQLREWRKAIRGVRDKSPPVALGLRVGERDAGHYELMIYRKGAWVLHMLRNLMLDLRTMDEGAFTAMMRDFYQTYRGRRASTQDFQRVLERHLGAQMDWFFNQWVYGTAVPTYVLSWRAEPAPDGEHLLRVRIRQEDVPENFMMLVPLLIEFRDKGQALVRVSVHGPVTETQFRLPAAARRIVLNPFESVLADVSEEVRVEDPPPPP